MLKLYILESYTTLNYYSGKFKTYNSLVKILDFYSWHTLNKLQTYIFCPQVNLNFTSITLKRETDLLFICDGIKWNKSFLIITRYEGLVNEE